MTRDKTAYSVFEYLYRDAANYKAWGSLLLSGKPTQKDIAVLRACMESGEYFVAEQVGIPPLYEELWALSDGPTEDDHALHEFVELRSAKQEDTETLPLFGELTKLLKHFRLYLDGIIRYRRIAIRVIDRSAVTPAMELPLLNRTRCSLPSRQSRARPG